MLGAIIGDIVGSRFEWDNCKSKIFTFFSKEKGCFFTDDSVMTVAVARSLLDCRGDFRDYDKLSLLAVHNMQQLGRLYPDRGYGGHFEVWLNSEDPRPYNSWGNGSAMRVSPCGLAAKSLEEAVKLSKAVTLVTHNHPEGIKGAEATAVAVFLAKSGYKIPEIRDYITANYYDIDFRLGDIRADYTFDVSCQGSVPQALEAFFESTGFEDAVRNAISIGGDSDTIAAITGGIAEAYYGIPEDLRSEALTYLDENLKSVINKFEEAYM